MQLVVGLGNPGARYARTRHNVGFEVVACLAERWGITLGDTEPSGARLGVGRIRSEPVTLVMPWTYMNRSGVPAAAVARPLGIDGSGVTIVHDELDLEFGTLRCKNGGGHGGHNGLRSIQDNLGRDTHRVRIGVGRPPEGVSSAEHVLGSWSEAEASALPGIIEKASDAVERIVVDGIQAAMNRFNVRSSSPAPPSVPRRRPASAESTTEEQT